MRRAAGVAGRGAGGGRDADMGRCDRAGVGQWDRSRETLTTIAYALDSLATYRRRCCIAQSDPREARLRAGTTLPVASRPSSPSTPRSRPTRHDRAPAAPRLPVRRAAAAGRGDRRSRPASLWLRMPLPFALDHINLWLLDGGRRRRRWSTAATATRRRARCGRRTSRRRWRGRRSRADHRDALPPRPRRQRRLARGALRRAGGDDARRVPDRARAAATSTAAHALADDRARCSRGTAWPREHLAGARRRAATTTARGVPELPRDVRRGCSTATRDRAGGTAVARDRGPRPLARARVAVLGRARAC